MATENVLIPTSLSMFESGRPVTYLADYRERHSKWQKWGDSGNIKPMDSAEYVKSLANRITYHEKQGRDVMLAVIP